MKVGDMVNYIPYADKNYGLGVITSIDDFNHRQTVMYVLFSTGVIGPIWKKHLEVISAAR
jgi:hypothetical protein